MSDELPSIAPERDEQLDRVWAQSESHPAVTVAEIGQMCRGSSDETRLLALLLMRREFDDEDPTDEFFDLARGLIEDENNNCRWQALIVIELFVDSRPDDVWRVIEQYGVSDDDDMRAGVACVLLEHVLDTHFERFFPTLREIILAGSANMTGALEMCAPPDSLEHRQQVRELFAQIGEDSPSHFSDSF